MCSSFETLLGSELYPSVLPLAYLDEFKILLVHLTCKAPNLKHSKLLLLNFYSEFSLCHKNFHNGGEVSAGGCLQGLQDSLSALDPRGDGMNPAFNQ